MLTSKSITISQLSLLISLCLLLPGCSENLGDSILGTWQCPNSILTLSEYSKWTVVSRSGGNSTSSGGYSLSSPPGWAGQIEGIAQYPFSQFQYLKSKPLSETITSMSGLILYAKTGSEMVQCKRVQQ